MHLNNSMFACTGYSAYYSGQDFRTENVTEVQFGIAGFGDEILLHHL
jgi:hypothetical protein